MRWSLRSESLKSIDQSRPEILKALFINISLSEKEKTAVVMGVKYHLEIKMISLFWFS